uniref:PB1 domain-containing protein n=1 Tax=Aegilops tauschii subsp. strangulata TaxID=200361 RepID=A0A453N9Q6_AEGTS
PGASPLGQRMPLTKVHKRGAISRSIDIGSFSGYGELNQALAHMFGMEGQLEDRQSIGWKCIYQDDEGDFLLLGDGPWEQGVCDHREVHLDLVTSRGSSTDVSGW